MNYELSDKINRNDKEKKFVLECEFSFLFVFISRANQL